MMDHQLKSTIQRLLKAGAPRSTKDWESQDGYFAEKCGVTEGDVPQLIEIACKWSDDEWLGDDHGLDDEIDRIVWLPILAWRALAELRASESVEPLVNMLFELEDEGDSCHEELPHVFGKIGKPAVDSMRRLVVDPDVREAIRNLALMSLGRVVEYHPENRDQIASIMIELMANAQEDQIHFNSLVLFELVELGVSEAAEVIERAFASNHLDIGMLGDWEAVRRKLGVPGLGLEMPEYPYNSIEELRRRMGIGIFSESRIYRSHETDPDAEHAYYERAWDLFSKSNQGKQAAEQFGGFSWHNMLLRYGLRQFGRIVDAMDLDLVHEFVFEYIPVKVSTDPDCAEAIITELRLFWEYIDEVFSLENARSIINWLNSDGLVEDLESELACPENYGMAKSFVMAGMNAGYDMTSQEDSARFMLEFNQSLDRTSGATTTATPISKSKHQKTGRNDPCPCGSGRKYKKCCR